MESFFFTCSPGAVFLSMLGWRGGGNHSAVQARLFGVMSVMLIPIENKQKNNNPKSTSPAGTLPPAGPRSGCREWLLHQAVEPQQPLEPQPSGRRDQKLSSDRERPKSSCARQAPPPLTCFGEEPLAEPPPARRHRAEPLSIPRCSDRSPSRPPEQPRGDTAPPVPRRSSSITSSPSAGRMRSIAVPGLGRPPAGTAGGCTHNAVRRCPLRSIMEAAAAAGAAGAAPPPAAARPRTP